MDQDMPLSKARSDPAKTSDRSLTPVSEQSDTLSADHSSTRSGHATEDDSGKEASAKIYRKRLA
ncbi:hypothetical protein AC578_824 [Pseudocercospora eumusae]|uniref:Uncharacterized protein n=1 Tax=Pseudocercospora eumusae TaxID=321146 RepID=A0A139HBZ8_9PEZI|nr:hypothetical protein AC578_824 [Pseudocercospora eumusae]